MTFAHGETVTILRRGVEVDPYSGEEAPSSVYTHHADVGGCAVWPGTSDEPTTALDPLRVETSLTVAMPPGTDVDSLDRLVVRGRRYSVIGDPFDYVHPMTGWRPGVLVKVTRTDGG